MQCLTLLVVLRLLLASPAIAGPRQLLRSAAETLTGTAIVISQEWIGQPERSMLAVRTVDGSAVRVELADAGQLDRLRTGMHVQLTGRWEQQGERRSSVAGGAAASAGSAGAHPVRRRFKAAIITASGGGPAAPAALTAVAGTGGRAAGAAGPTRTTTLSFNQVASKAVNTIFIPIAGVSAPDTACPKTFPPKFTVDQVKRAVFEEANPKGATVGAIYNRCSYGKSRLTQRNSLVADVVELPCEGTSNGVPWSFATCKSEDLDGYASAADEALLARGVDLSLYKYRVYLIPPGPCAFVGLAFVGCGGGADCRSWIGPDFWTSPAAIVHEIGHNLFLEHAGAVREGKYDEYADLSASMGYCCADRCPNTPHAWQLGWVSLQQLDGTSLKPGQTVTAATASQSLSSRTGLRIVPTWAKAAAPLFVGYRTRAGGDVATTAGASGIAGKVHIYTANITGSFDPAATTWWAALATPGQAWEYPGTGMVVRLKSASAAAAVVTVCRRGGAETLASCQEGQDRDCNGLAGAQDTNCARILKRARAAALKPPRPWRLR